MTIFHIIGYWYLAIALIALAAFFTAMCASYVREVLELFRVGPDADDADRWRAFRAALTGDDPGFQTRIDAYWEARGGRPALGAATADEIDAAADAARCGRAAKEA